MKTKISIAALLAAVTLVTANVQAQYFPSVGGGLAWGGEIQTIGVQARGDFQFGDYFAIAPHLTYFLPKTVGSEKWNWLSMNVDMHYLFGESRYLYFYPLAGVNVSHRSDNTTSNDNKESITRFGANLGFGGAYEVARESFVFLEFKYVLLAGELSQPEISAGMYFGLFGGSW